VPRAIGFIDETHDLSVLGDHIVCRDFEAESVSRATASLHSLNARIMQDDHSVTGKARRVRKFGDGVSITAPIMPPARSSAMGA